MTPSAACHAATSNVGFLWFMTARPVCLYPWTTYSAPPGTKLNEPISKFSLPKSFVISKGLYKMLYSILFQAQRELCKLTLSLEQDGISE
ncbi:Hypothetical protein PHPALM_14329 [Phytophthora palmivora]|uniref:Uncharacterized protein n=1 Tax=Phytophthora palmivora TaxID=4796 RepID=A0A2P4XUZ9_9STRA|nr:Hypothetical protein PHPALM_14329 [Phytophthora palmivora]